MSGTTANGKETFMNMITRGQLIAAAGFLAIPGVLGTAATVPALMQNSVAMQHEAQPAPMQNSVAMNQDSPPAPMQN